MSNSDKQKIKEALTRGVDELLPTREEFEELLQSGKKLRVKLGIDPTAPDLHLGHSVVLRKLRQFQDLGHTAVLIIGDFTATIGDPSGRSKERKPLSEAQIKKNMEKYLDQAGKVIDLDNAEIRYNSTWLKDMDLIGVFQLASSMTVKQILRRRDFRERWEQDNDIGMTEILYPMLQGYDSVEIKADVELGGTDQKLNLLIARKVQRHFDVSEQLVLTVPLLEGTDGEKKMSKSVGNYIGLGESPQDMFGKLMRVPDELIEKYFLLCTDVSESDVQEIINSNQNPRDQKLRLAEEVVELYHGGKVAEKTREDFMATFSEGEIEAEDLPPLRLTQDATVLDAVMASGLRESKTQARQLIEQGGVSVDDEKKTDPSEELALRGGEVLKIGKKDFFQVDVSD